MRVFACLLTVGSLLLGAVSPVSAETQHAAAPSVLDAAVQEHVSSAETDRQAVLDLLGRPDIKAIADGAGIDVRSVAAAVTSMDAAQLAAVAAQVQAVEESLAGGQSRVVINTTFLIIGLLILILLIVAID